MAIQVEDVNDPSKVVNVKGRSDSFQVYMTSLVAGENQAFNVMETINGGADYETVAASASDQVLGSSGAAGDYLGRLVCVVSTATSAQVQIKDGSGSAITVFPNSPGGGVGSYQVPLGIKSTGGAWKVTTGGGVSVIACGIFS